MERRPAIQRTGGRRARQPVFYLSLSAGKSTQQVLVCLTTQSKKFGCKFSTGDHLETNNKRNSQKNTGSFLNHKNLACVQRTGRSSADKSFHCGVRELCKNGRRHNRENARRVERQSDYQRTPHTAVCGVLLRLSQIKKRGSIHCCPQLRQSMEAAPAKYR